MEYTPLLPAGLLVFQASHSAGSEPCMDVKNSRIRVRTATMISHRTVDSVRREPTSKERQGSNAIVQETQSQSNAQRQYMTRGQQVGIYLGQRFVLRDDEIKNPLDEHKIPPATITNLHRRKRRYHGQIKRGFRDYSRKRTNPDHALPS